MEQVAIRKQIREEEEREARKLKELEKISTDWFTHSLMPASSKIGELFGRKNNLASKLSSPIASIEKGISRREQLEFKTQRVFSLYLFAYM